MGFLTAHVLEFQADGEGVVDPLFAGSGGKGFGGLCGRAGRAVAAPAPAREAGPHLLTRSARSASVKGRSGSKGGQRFAGRLPTTASSRARADAASSRRRCVHQSSSMR